MNIQLHCHTDDSLNDGAIPLSYYDEKSHKSYLVDRLQEIGCTAFATTEHGNMMSDKIVDDLLAGTGIKHIHGLEAYVERDEKMRKNTGAEFIRVFEEARKLEKRDHLVLLAADYIGYKALMKCVTASNDNRDGRGFPMMTDELLRKYFGVGSEGHGHVIALSACMQGVVSSQLLHNHWLEADALKEEAKAGKNDFDETEYAVLQESLEDKMTELEALDEKIDLLNTLRKKNFKKRVKDLEKWINEPQYEEMRKALDDEQNESSRAAAEYPILRESSKTLSKECTALRNALKKMDAKLDKIQVYLDKASELRSKKISEEEMNANASARALAMCEIFGEDNFFLELQYHGIPEEEIVFPQILALSYQLGIPTCATNDAHMLRGSDEDRKRRQALRSLRFNSWEDEMVGDTELYLKTNEELKSWLVKIIPAEDADIAIENNSVIADRCNVEFPEEDHYPKWQGEKPADETLMELVEAGKSKVENWTDEYQERLDYELRVIRKLKVVDYLVIVADFLHYGELLGKIDLNDPEFLADPFNIEKLEKLAEGKVGKGTGTGRGSAVGSLVCYLAGITGLDPLRYGLLFERFLNEDRVSMPDIDSDFLQESRGYVIDYVRHKYGDEAVCCIMTVGTLGAKAAVRACARIIGEREKKRNDGDDAVKKRFYNLGSDICSVIPTGPGIKLGDYEEAIRQKFENNPEALEILDEALVVEGSCAQIGTHAAGVIIADNGDVKEYLPLMYAKDGSKVTQFDKNYCEAVGLLKMDFLGLKNLSIMTEALRLIEKDTGKKIDIDKIDLSDPFVFSNIFAVGKTDSVFQFESPGMKALLKRFKPTAMEHLILLNAMYRPGPMQYIDTVCNVKQGTQEPEYIIPEMQTVLGETYGKPIYQEQIMQIFNRFAGFSLGESDIIRRYMSKKKTEKFMAYHDKFIDGLVEHGADKGDAERFWLELVDFSKYCFNKSHAAAYAVTAYYNAWLKLYYPKEYLTAILNNTEFEKVGLIIDDVRSYGVKVLPPDVNQSEYMFTPMKNTPEIRYGLSNIKRVASGAKSIIAERTENGPYISYEDFASRAGVPRDTMEALIMSGACDCLAVGNNVRQWRKQVLTDLESKSVPADEVEGLIQEKEAIGTFLSANPAKGYKAKNKLVNARLHVGRDIQIVGVITNFKVRFTKATGDEMATCKIEDDTGTISACIFPSSYAVCKDMMRDNAILSVIGKVQYDSRSDDEDAVQLNVRSVKMPERAISSIILKTDKPSEYTSVIKEYADENGVLLSVMSNSGRIRPSSTKVRVTILGDNRIAENLIANA